MRARTIRVVFAAKLLEKLILHALLDHLVYVALKLLPEPVPGQRALAGTRSGIPQTDRSVIAA